MLTSVLKTLVKETNIVIMSWNLCNQYVKINMENDILVNNTSFTTLKSTQLIISLKIMHKL